MGNSIVATTVGGPVVGVGGTGVGVGGTGVGVNVGARDTSTVLVPKALTVCVIANLVPWALASRVSSTLACVVARASVASSRPLSRPGVPDSGEVAVGLAVEATGPEILRAVVGDAGGAGSSGMLEEGSAVACSASACVADTTTVGLAICPAARDVGVGTTLNWEPAATAHARPATSSEATDTAARNR